jgi:hypothetical protein
MMTTDHEIITVHYELIYASNMRHFHQICVIFMSRDDLWTVFEDVIDPFPYTLHV